VTADRTALDLRHQQQVEEWMAARRPDVVVVAAGTVGGIHANEAYPADFLHDNLMIEANLIHAAHRQGVAKLLFLGSSCIYPRDAPQPMREEALLTGPLEPTNQWYAIAKIAGIKLCQAYRRQHGRDFISAMPANLYGPGDTFDHETSHVPAALLRRFHEAKVTGAPDVTVWGTGTPRREFLYVDDLADACVFLLKHYSGEGHINIGTGKEISIADFAEKIRAVVGYDGGMVFDASLPDGTPRKLMDVGRLTGLGWTAATGLDEGLQRYYGWFLGAVSSIDKLLPQRLRYR
jgi:GDP-L-fucose synthase